MLHRYAFLLCLALLFGRCQPKDPLPRATQIGANTFGCKIDGKTYIPDGGGPFSGLKPIEGGYLITIHNPRRRVIYIRVYAQNKEQLSLYIDGFAVGTYPLNLTTRPRPDNPIPESYGFYQSTSGAAYITNAKCTGSVRITKSDTLSGIISGNFSFTPCSSLTGSQQTVSITEGRFDIGPR